MLCDETERQTLLNKLQSLRERKMYWTIFHIVTNFSIGSAFLFRLFTRKSGKSSNAVSEVKLFVQKPHKGDACFATLPFSESLAVRAPLLWQSAVCTVRGSEEADRCTNVENTSEVCRALCGWRHWLSYVLGLYLPSAGELVSFATTMLGLPKRYSLMKSLYRAEGLWAEELQSELTVGNTGGSSAEGIPQQEQQLLHSCRKTSGTQWQKAGDPVI